MTCERCGTPIPRAATGRPRRWCGDACRKVAERAAHRHAIGSGKSSGNSLLLTAHVGGNAALFARIMGQFVPPNSLVADVTYGRGVFWKRVQPESYRLLASDIQTGTDLRCLPYDDASIDCVVLDPPYQEGLFRRSTDMMAGHGSHAAFRERYSSGQATPDDEGPKWHAAVVDLYVRGGREAHRVLRNKGVLIVKCQDEVSAGKQHLTHHEVINAYMAMGFESLDLFVVVRRNRPAVSGASRQVHARKNHSYFVVFAKKRQRSGGLTDDVQAADQPV